MLLAEMFLPRSLHVTQRSAFQSGDTFQAFAPGEPPGIMLDRSDAAATQPDQFADNRPANIQKFYRSIDPNWRIPFALHVAADGGVAQFLGTEHLKAGEPERAQAFFAQAQSQLDEARGKLAPAVQIAPQRLVGDL